MKARRKTSQRKTNFVFNRFSNLHLFSADPLKLRFDSFVGTFPYQIFETNLRDAWRHAYRYLQKENQLPSEADLERYEREAYSGLSELGYYESTFTDAQKNALDVLRSVRRIQFYLYEDRPVYEQSGPVQYEPIGFEKNEQFEIPANVRDEMKNDPEGFLANLERRMEQRIPRILREFGLEVLHLRRSTMACDFHSEIWPHTQAGLASNNAPKKKGQRDSLYELIKILRENEGLGSAAKIWLFLTARARETSDRAGKTTQVPFRVGPVIITSIKKTELTWKTHAEGKAKTILRHTFENRISKINKASKEHGRKMKENILTAFYDSNKWKPTPFMSRDEWRFLRRKSKIPVVDADSYNAAAELASKEFSKWYSRLKNKKGSRHHK